MRAARLNGNRRRFHQNEIKAFTQCGIQHTEGMWPALTSKLDFVTTTYLKIRLLVYPTQNDPTQILYIQMNTATQCQQETEICHSNRYEFVK